MNRETLLGRLKDHSREIRERYGVKELFLFGSAARGEAVASSDVDVLVDFEGRADFPRFMGLRFYLEDLLCLRVDLVTRKALRPEMRETVQKEAIHVA